MTNIFHKTFKKTLTNRNLKILVIRFSSIGDIVLTTPVVRGLKLQLGGEVHFLTKNSFQNLLILNPYIDKVFSIKKNVTEVLPQLKAEQYDYIIDLHKNIRSQQIRWALKAKYFSFDKINLEKWLMVNFKHNRLPSEHIVMRYMKAVEKLGVQYDGGGLDYFFSEGVERFVLPEDFEYSFRGAGGLNTYIAFAIGGAHATKRLPVKKIISICKKIKLPIILLGGKGDATIGEEIVLAINNKQKIYNGCGKLTLDQSAWVVKEAHKVITHDTGMMHIAAAFQKEIVSIWGNTIPEFGMHPFYKKEVNLNTTIQVQELSCRPCSKIGFEKCPKGHFKCMNEIDEEAIEKAINT